jgi:rfaE bifunctional protein kinase chain/domain
MGRIRRRLGGRRGSKSVSHSFLKKFETVNLLVAGEVGIDEYIWGDTRRISPEAPVPVVEVGSVNYKLGLSANVAQNIVSLGGRVSLVSVRGTDRDGDTVETMLKEAGIPQVSMIRDDSRPTLRKSRVIAQKQHVVRIDYEKSHPLTAALAKQFRERVCDLVPASDGIVVQDYGKGIWTEDTMTFLQHAKVHRKPVFVDPSRNSPVALYRGVTLLTPNLIEAQTLTGFYKFAASVNGNDDERLQQMGSEILERSGAQEVVITCGEWGMVSMAQGKLELKRIPTFARQVYDVTGAGDTVVAVLALMYVLGHPLSQCMQVANAAAGIVVGQIGAACVTQQELIQELNHLEAVGLISNTV